MVNIGNGLIGAHYNQRGQSVALSGLANQGQAGGKHIQLVVFKRSNEVFHYQIDTDGYEVCLDPLQRRIHGALAHNKEELFTRDITVGAALPERGDVEWIVTTDLLNYPTASEFPPAPLNFRQVLLQIPTDIRLEALDKAIYEGRRGIGDSALPVPPISVDLSGWDVAE